MTVNDLFDRKHRNTTLTLGIIFFGQGVLYMLSGGMDLDKGGIRGYFTQWFVITQAVLSFLGFFLLLAWFGTRKEPEPPEEIWVIDENIRFKKRSSEPTSEDLEGGEESS